MSAEKQAAQALLKLAEELTKPNDAQKFKSALSKVVTWLYQQPGVSISYKDVEATDTGFQVLIEIPIDPMKKVDSKSLARGALVRLKAALDGTTFTKFDCFDAKYEETMEIGLLAER